MSATREKLIFCPLRCAGLVHYMPRKKQTEPKAPKAPKAPKKTANPLNKVAKFIVSKYVIPGQINWPRDIKIANQLLESYPSGPFWEFLPCTFQSPTLASLLTAKAQSYLRSEWLKFNLVLPVKEEYKLETHKVGEDLEYKVITKPRSILDFCR